MMLPSLRDWRRFRQAERELASMTDRELTDLGIARADIPDAVRGRRTR